MRERRGRSISTPPLRIRKSREKCWRCWTKCGRRPMGMAFPNQRHPLIRAPSPASSLPNGTSLGRFVITGFVGQGGMGRVYSAHDPDLNREVALKVITPKAEASSSERFIREAQAASALNHPNIVTVYEVIRSGPTVAIAMELVSGTSLRHYCGTAQPVETLALWGRQIAHALAEAHARGIVHRDIKPENLMLRPDGYIKVLDFGLARRAGVDRADDELALGTLGYMSPEEIEQRPITAASDIFSLGVVLYELASGTNPFRGDSAGATTRMILGLAPPPLPVKAGPFQRNSIAWCARCSASRPATAPPLRKSHRNWKRSQYRECGSGLSGCRGIRCACRLSGGRGDCSVAWDSVRIPDLSARKPARRRKTAILFSRWHPGGVCVCRRKGCDQPHIHQERVECRVDPPDIGRVTGLPARLLSRRNQIGFPAPDRRTAQSHGDAIEWRDRASVRRDRGSSSRIRIDDMGRYRPKPVRG